VADVNRGNRPLSPHLSIYRPQINSVLSIVHRITGTGLTITALLVVWWFLAGATNAAYYTFVDDLMTSRFGGLILIISAWALWYHFCNGIRHLVWDLGYGFEIEEIGRSSYIVLGASVLLTIITIIVA
jgi:succinate dehydrogenase / fumarate reductase cytochrome b subunit